MRKIYTDTRIKNAIKVNRQPVGFSQFDYIIE